MTDAYRQGLRAMEAGRYREAVTALKSALEAQPHDPQIKLWLAMAYEALQEWGLARDLCRELTTHPDPKVRQQSQQVLYILEAPRLRRRSEWVNRIPLLTEEAAVPWRVGIPKKVKPPEEDLPPPRSVAQSNGFVPLALGALLILLVWWGWVG
ncbi:MAG: tetratricopeptide repeat protein [Gloeomargarita sp. SKYBB_i_bin120]|nr:tetratricopeptide repeat protein [Gloeomargarita sp. SKYG98]MCS7292553.1 tetratricopeptide repeat protein [Gloeomargarita sp. SKYB120]MDW8178114.1 tetratricopeptide repeat protein [Gloeomargarita sp. SKYBB_i_bin120]